MDQPRAWPVGLALAAVLLAGCVRSAADTDPGTERPGSPAPAGSSGREALLGRWLPVLASTPSSAWKTPPFVQFSADGSWHGSDGCNGQRGRWTIGADGAFQGSNETATRIGCDNVEVQIWVRTARTAAIDGAILVLRDSGGAELGRLRR